MTKVQPVMLAEGAGLKRVKEFLLYFWLFLGLESKFLLYPSQLVGYVWGSKILTFFWKLDTIRSVNSSGLLITTSMPFSLSNISSTLSMPWLSLSLWHTSLSYFYSFHYALFEVCGHLRRIGVFAPEGFAQVWIFESNLVVVHFVTWRFLPISFSVPPHRYCGR